MSLSLRTHLLLHVTVVAVLVAWPHAVELMRSFGVNVPGTVTRSYVQTPPLSRGMQRPVVLVEFSYRWSGKEYRSLTFYQPQSDSALNWGDEEHAAARDFIARHPPGSGMTIRTSPQLPWIGMPTPPFQDDANLRFGRWMSSLFNVFLYAMGAAFVWAFGRRFKTWRNARKVP